jgi:hypothetical protein
VFLLLRKASETKKAAAIPRSAPIGYDPTGLFGKPLSSEASTGEALVGETWSLGP